MHLPVNKKITFEGVQYRGGDKLPENFPQELLGGVPIKEKKEEFKPKPKKKRGE